MHTVAVLALFSLWIGEYDDRSVAAETTGSSCVDCHTNLKRLIRLIWEIEETQPKPQKSTQTSGEG
jgi:hypothetical protein